MPATVHVWANAWCVRYLSKFNRAAISCVSAVVGWITCGSGPGKHVGVDLPMAMATAKVAPTLQPLPCLQWSFS